MSDLLEQYQQIEAVLRASQIEELTPSELHGIVVGAICNHLKTGQTPDLVKLIEPSASVADGQLQALADHAYGLYRETSEVFFETKEGFGVKKIVKL